MKADHLMSPAFSTRQPIDPVLRLQITTHSHHTCKLCGGGCRSYDVMLTEREAKRLDYDMWRPLLNDVPDTLPLVRLDEATHQYTLNKVDGRCVFLDTDNLCIVHKAAGADAKPIACQFFPMQAVQAPDGIHVSLNVGCRRLIEMTDADPIPDLADARRLLDQVQAIATIGETLPLTPTDTISYAEFLEWQVRLLDILAVPETTWAHTWTRWQSAATLLLSIPTDAPTPNTDGTSLFRALHTLIGQTPPVRSTLNSVYQRSVQWLDVLGTAPTIAMRTLPTVSPEFFAVVARQFLAGQHAALYRTAHTGWTALLAALIGGVYGAAERIAHIDQRPDHALNEAVSDAIDLFLSPAGQLALTEPNQAAFLRGLARNVSDE